MSKKNRISKQATTLKIPIKLLWFYSLVSLLVIPVFYYNKVIDLTLIPKFFLLACLLLFFYFFFILAPKYKLPDMSIFKRGAVISWLALILISIFSLFNAINPSEGIFDIFKLVLLLLFLIATFSLLINSDNFSPFLISILILSVIYIIIGFYEYFEYAFGHSDLESLMKINGIKSHKNVFAGSLYLLLPFLFYNVITADFSRKVFPSILIFLLFTIILLIQTRSIYLALFFFGLMSFVLMLIFRKKTFTKNNKRKNYRGFLYIGISFILAFLIAWAITNRSFNISLNKNSKIIVNKSAPKNSAEITKINERISSIFDTKSENNTSKRRLEIWKITLKMIKKHPVLGIGTGNWKIVVPSYFETDYLKNYFHNWRRPHNDFIWLFAEKGIFGLLAYLAFFFYLLLYSIRILIKSNNPTSRLFVIFMISGIFGYCFLASFSFPYERIELQIFFMLMASVIIWIYHQSFPVKTKIKKQTRTIFIGIIIMFLIAALIVGRIWIRAEQNTKYAYTALNSGLNQQVIYFIDRAYSPIAQIDARNGPVLWFRGKANMSLNKLNEAKLDFEKSLTQNPYSVMVLKDLGTVNGLLGNYQEAIECFDKALEIYPGYTDALMNLAVVYYNLEQYQNSLDCFNKCKTNKENPKLDNMINEVVSKLQSEKKLK